MNNSLINKLLAVLTTESGDSLTVELEATGTRGRRASSPGSAIFGRLE